MLQVSPQLLPLISVYKAETSEMNLISSKRVSFEPELALLWHMWFCYGRQIFNLVSSTIVASTGPVLATTRNLWGSPLIGHNSPSTLLNYGKSVQGQYWATSGPELCLSGDTWLLVHTSIFSW